MIKQTNETYGDYICVSDKADDKEIIRKAAELVFDKVIEGLREIVLSDVEKYFVVKEYPEHTSVGFKISIFKREIE